MCEDDDDVKKLMKDIPSFKKKYTLSPQYDHGTFWYPVGDVADEIVGNIVKALNDDWTSEENEYDSENDDDFESCQGGSDTCPNDDWTSEDNDYDSDNDDDLESCSGDDCTYSDSYDTCRENGYDDGHEQGYKDGRNLELPDGYDGYLADSTDNDHSYTGSCKSRYEDQYAEGYESGYELGDYCA